MRVSFREVHNSVNHSNLSYIYLTDKISSRMEFNGENARRGKMNSRVRNVSITVSAILTLLMVIYLNLYTGNATSDSVVVPGVKFITGDKAGNPILVLDQSALTACANNKSGVVRLISKGKCDPKNEKIVAWSIQGAAGIAGASAGRTYYLDPTANSDISGYRVATASPGDTSEFALSYRIPGPTSGLVAVFITPKNDPNVTILPAGIARRNFYVSTGDADNLVQLRLELFKRSTSGVETLLRSGNSPIIGSVETVLLSWDYPDTTGYLLLPTDRLVFKLYAHRLGGDESFPVVIDFNDHEHASNIQTTITVGATGATGATGPQGPSG